MRRDPIAREARLLVGNVPLVLGGLSLAAVAVLAFLGPSLAPYDPQAWRLVEFYPGGDIAVPPIRPGPFHWLGTDTMGRDILSRLLWGARLTLAGVLLAVVGRAAIGVAVGLLAAWRSGLVDVSLRRAIDALAGFPQLMAALLLVVILKDLGLIGFALALSLVGWPEIAQFVRAEALRLRAAPYVEAARGLGARSRHIVRAHLARNLAPQLAGLFALEAGSVLLLLAELGFIGFFISGGTFFTDEQGRPILPIRDRAPEWGQMLAGARYHTFVQQWVAFVPALVVSAVVVGFNLFGEGLRAAIDPFGTHRLSPRTLGALGRGFGALVLVGAVGFTWTAVRSLELPFDEGARLAREAAARESPGSEMVAAVVRFSSTAHALARPEKVNYYFRGRDGARLRVGFVGADANAMEVKRFEDEDRFDRDWDLLRPLEASAPRLSWQEALTVAERRGGTSYRNRTAAWTVRVVLQRRAEDGPRYRVRYSAALGAAPIVDIPVDARSGEAKLSFQDYLRDASERASANLRAESALTGAGATWASLAWLASGQAPSLPHPDGLGYPISVSFTFHDLAGSRSVAVGYETRNGLIANLGSVSALAPGAPLPQPLPAFDLFALYERFEEAGGRDLREEWERRGLRRHTVFVNVGRREGRAVATAFYQPEGASAVRFRLDLQSGSVERLVPGVP